MFGPTFLQNMYDYGVVMVPDAAEGRDFDLVPMMPGEEMNIPVLQIPDTAKATLV